jgi:hypothetical protein
MTFAILSLIGAVDLVALSILLRGDLRRHQRQSRDYAAKLALDRNCYPPPWLQNKR